MYNLLTDLCPVIKANTKIEILKIFNFPATNKQFVTIKDLENFNINLKGHKEDIISTIELLDNTLEKI